MKGDAEPLVIDFDGITDAEFFIDRASLVRIVGNYNALVAEVNRTRRAMVAFAKEAGHFTGEAPSLREAFVTLSEAVA